MTAEPLTAGPRPRTAIEVAVARQRVSIGIVVVIALLVSVNVAVIGTSLAIFTARPEAAAVFGTKALFPGERVTPAFQVGDASSGTVVDRSSPFTASSDGLTMTTSAWWTAFAADRYLEFDLNDSLASGIATTSATFDFTFATTGAGQACYYFEVRSISTNAVLGTYGSSGSPLGCVTGTTLTTFSTPMSSVATTSIANDLRIRVFGRDSANNTMVIDGATVGGSTIHQDFTLYPVVFRDAADTTLDIVPWGLLVP
jgi:hypothetical protein